MLWFTWSNCTTKASAASLCSGGSVRCAERLGDCGQPARQIVLVVGDVACPIGFVDHIPPEVIGPGVGGRVRIGAFDEPVQGIVLIARHMAEGIRIG